MAKNIKELFAVDSAESLLTPRDKTRGGFIAMALEKGNIAVPYIDEAKALRALALPVKHPSGLLQIQSIQNGLLTATGLSEKSWKYLSEEDKAEAMKGLVDEFLLPAGSDFVEELVYRFLLFKGDALGGKARNLAGVLGERKFIRFFLSVLRLSNTPFRWLERGARTWIQDDEEECPTDRQFRAFSWRNRFLVLNMRVPLVEKNVDVSILQGTPEEWLSENLPLIHAPERYISLGELKGGIDPAGADEHWKTARTALERIRNRFQMKNRMPKTFFIGAAIENAMADEIFSQLESGSLDNAANLTNDAQLTNICDWIVNL